MINLAKWLSGKTLVKIIVKGCGALLKKFSLRGQREAPGTADKIIGLAVGY